MIVEFQSYDVSTSISLSVFISCHLMFSCFWLKCMACHLTSGHSTKHCEEDVGNDNHLICEVRFHIEHKMENDPLLFGLQRSLVPRIERGSGKVFHTRPYLLDYLPNSGNFIYFFNLLFLSCTWRCSGLYLHSSIIPGKLGEPYRCWGLNLGWPHGMQVPYLEFFLMGPNQWY